MKKILYSYVDGEYYDNGRKINWEEVEAINNKDLLSFILERGNDDWVSWFAALNPNCPSEALAKVLERGNDDGVSKYTVSNPNCPVEAKIKWYYALNKNIDSGEKRLDDEDILKKLISV